MWVENRRPDSSACLRPAANSSGVTVSICAGKTIASSRRELCASASAITRLAFSNSASPRASSHFQVTVCGALMPQRAEAKVGAA